MTWKSIDGYDGLYKVNKKGEVLGLKGKLKPYPTRQGYMMVRLYKNAKHKDFQVHRLVALAFIPNPENKREVNHIDGNKGNNNITNLEWVTPKENVKHAWKNNLTSKTKEAMERHAQELSTPVIAKNVITGEEKEFESQREACKMLNLSPPNVNATIKGRRRSCGGFAFRYK